MAQGGEKKQVELANGEWKEKPPEEVQNAVDAYQKAVRANSRAAAKKRGADEACRSAMKRHNIHRVRVEDEDGKPRFLVCDPTEKLKFETIKKDD